MLRSIIKLNSLGTLLLVLSKKRMSWKSRSYTLYNEEDEEDTKAGLYTKRRSATGVINPTFELTEPQLTDFVIEAPYGGRQQSQNSTTGYNVDDHRIPLQTLFQRYQTNPVKGLTPEIVKKNHNRYGPNMLFPPKKASEIVKFAKNCLLGLNLLFWICGIMSLVVYAAQYFTLDEGEGDNDNLYSGISLLVVVLVAGCFSYYQEFKSSKVMESFRTMMPNFAIVWREGRRMEMNVQDIVVGDIVEIKYGDRVPADMRIIQCEGLKVDNSSLTGESEPQKRTVVYTDNNPMETSNLVFFSTNVLEGSGKGVVYRVGEGTFMGRLASLATSLDPTDTPIAKDMNRIINIMTVLSLTFGIVFLGVGFTMHYTWINAVFFAIGIIIANVPESLNVSLTIILALTAKKMADKNCLVKQLHAVETLGSATVICSDKTGTLTQNKMSVAHMWFNGAIADADTSEFQDTGYVFDGKDPGFSALANVAILCSRARFRPGQDDVPILKRLVEGDSSESAILRCMEMQVGNVEICRERFPKVCEIPFNSRNKFQVSIHDTGDRSDPRYLLVLKGAPERVVDMCTTILVEDIEYDMNDFWKRKIDEAYATFGELGERVLGFCDCRLPMEQFPKGYYRFDSDNPEFLKVGFRFVGLISMIDPPRAAVPDAVSKCRNAGIKVVMVTGDHPITATAIARAVGIISEGSKTIQEISAEKQIDICDLDPSLATAAVVTGTRLAEMASQELDDLLINHEEIVFARTSPEQKYLIVEAFQRTGNVVAVTGDGVNDAPALKKADIGIAMGITGTDVAKEVANMILLDDNFATLVSGVEDGRLIFDNLRKLFRYVMADNVAEMYSYCVFVILKIPVPIGTIAMLLSTSGTDILPAVSLAYESAEADIMKLKPRDQTRDTLVTQASLSYAYGQISLLETCAGFFAYFVVLGYHGWLPDRLLFIQDKWDSMAIQDLTDSYGQEWSYTARQKVGVEAQTAFFVALVGMQWVNLIACKTRRLSIFQKKMKNHAMNAALVISPIIAAIFMHTPGLNEGVNLSPLCWQVYVAIAPFLLLTFVYDELRRWAVRTFRNGWVAQELYV